MKRLTVYGRTYLASLVLFYVAGVFVSLEPNLFVWTEAGRAALMWLAFFPTALFAVHRETRRA